ncbi:DUF1289 domain-containing protein [Ruegeria pomeroyi]|uniref:DUF1289 domain-containing protein n=1 Tax=Ruegeria pomeroyi TaxID=89184 RepID=UPI001F366FF8|nr:DUF1289 domain-containing protein [Ruegeria pomeroyi]MCE8506823.1 DUF1289 domain-containing protein [Ruegeria pomeroyi]MCE8516910.1 DUF1289 domain-containing protein [Ruegeria pomeroyi]MCE8554341.1 DUF1289 domain-containing protein [Ruegeria pomeroyi]
MTDTVWKRNEIDSPCIRICVVHPTERICTGCFRTIDEISRWSRMESDERARIMAELPARAPNLSKRRGGRAARLRG